MAASSGNSTVSASSSLVLQNYSGSEENLKALMEQRKRKRMQSNRESARRSRLRKQKHLDDLVSQVSQLRKENNQILNTIKVTTQHYMDVEAQNLILRAQLIELGQRLESLNEIVNVINTNSNNNSTGYYDNNDDDSDNNWSFVGFQGMQQASVGAEGLMNSMNLVYLNQPIMASPDPFQY